MTAVLVFVGGSVGAVLRYFTDRMISARHDMVFPWGTFVVNVGGSAGLGFVYGLSTHAPHWAAIVLGTGLCGALTTFSTFSYETVRLLEEGSVREATLNVVLSLVLGLGVATGAYALAQALV
ncbi:MAG: fluoride efflux transporter CrcB [Nocardioidaceae bacterium]